MLLSPPPKMQFFGNDGLPLSGGFVYTYAKGTTTPLATYNDGDGTTPNANPIELDSQGRATIWMQMLPYTFVVNNSVGVLQECGGDIEFTSNGTALSDAEPWSDIVTYSFPDIVAGSDGFTYRCVEDNILNDDPVGSLTGAWINLNQNELKADLASPHFTGIPTAPTASAGTNTTQLATTAFVFAGLAGKQASLGFTPVQQGTGTGQDVAKVVKIGSDGSTGLKATVDSTDLGKFLFEGGLPAAINTAMVGSAGANGYQKFSNGIVLQWGYNTASNTTKTITFPIAFGAVYAVILSATSTLTTEVFFISKDVTVTSFNARNPNPVEIGFYWLAIGYITP